jgi:uroporphyrinogen-III decarboxylase
VGETLRKIPKERGCGREVGRFGFDARPQTSVNEKGALGVQQSGGNVLGLDWRLDLASTWDQLKCRAIQGNLDPTLLFSGPEVFGKEVQRLLQAVGSRPGFIFNLGHGILPETPVDHVMALVDQVHSWKI